MLTSKHFTVDNISNIPVLPGKHNQLYMHPVDLQSGKINLPEAFNVYARYVEQMLVHSPTKTGRAFVTIDQKVLPPNKSQRRPGFHVDGNYLYGWGGGWLVGTSGRLLTDAQHKEQYCSPSGGTLLYTNTGGTKLLSGTFKEEPLQGGNCENVDTSSLVHSVTNPGDVVLLNSTCIHDGPRFEDKTVNRVLIRITLPNNFSL